jgi:hypothetical protein
MTNLEQNSSPDGGRKRACSLTIYDRGQKTKKEKLSFGMVRAVFWWWLVLLLAINKDHYVVHGTAVASRRDRSLKKSRTEHGDYYNYNFEPIKPKVLFADNANVTANSTNKGGAATDDPMDSKEEDGDSKKHYSGSNATIVLSKLKGDASYESYGTTAKGGEKDNANADDDSVKRTEKPARTIQKGDPPPSKSPSARSKGSTKSTAEGKTQPKKKKTSGDSTKSTSSDDKKSKMKLEKEEKDEKSSKESKGVKGTKKHTKGEDDTTKPGAGSSGNGGAGECASSVASAIMEALPDVTTLNPTSCCDKTGAIAAYVTHAIIDGSDSAETGLSKFWQEAYDTIAKASAAHNVCFVFVARSTSDPQELARTMHDMVLTISTMVGSWWWTDCDM